MLYVSVFLMCNRPFVNAIYFLLASICIHMQYVIANLQIHFLFFKSQKYICCLYKGDILYSICEDKVRI